MTHWLERIIPRYQPEGGWRWWMWCIFGNQDAGIFGQDDHYGKHYPGLEPSLWLAIQWFCRNPMANLFKIVMAWPRDPVRILVQWSAVYGWAFWLERSPQAKWVGDEAQFTIAAVPPGIAWKRLAGTEGYFGFHSMGWFGMAFRRAHDK